MTSHPFDNEFVVTDEQKEQFQRDGFVKLEGFLNADVVGMLLDRTDIELNRSAATPTPAQPPRSARYSTTSGQPRPTSSRCWKRPYFQKTLTGLTDRDLFLTFELSFEVEKNVNEGLPWHVGVQSFGFQFAEDFGCTIWAPLQPINASGQRGGMAYVPEHVLPASSSIRRTWPSSKLSGPGSGPG